MNIKAFIFACFLMTISLMSAKPIVSYKVSMPQPHTHYFQVELTVESPSGSSTELMMPVWTPGSYLVREYARNIEAEQATVKTTDGKSEKVSVKKTSKNHWVVEHGKKISSFTFTYQYYAFEHSVRTSILDADHGYINPASLFVVPVGTEKDSYTIKIEPAKGWKTVVSPLEQPKPLTLVTKNLDQFIDSPIEIGNPDVFKFTASGVEHTVAMHGGGNYEVEKLKADFKKCVEVATNIFGSNPNKKYTFIIHNTEAAGGGLEHLESTSLMIPRSVYDNEKAYVRLLSLVIHEYFHLWNVKRLRPEALGPFNYEEENYTNLLWISEGFTSFFDEFLLRTAGFITEDELLQRIENNINNVETQFGNKVQAVTEASHDAWIKFYRPDENSANSRVSYYSKGYNVALCLDLILRTESDNAFNLGTFLKNMYNNIYLNQKQRGFNKADVVKELTALAPNYDFKSFIATYVEGTEMLPYASLMAKIGVDFNEKDASKPYLGASLKEEGKTFEISRLKRSTTAYDAGLNVNDELIAINDDRVKSNWESIMNLAKVGDQVSFTVSRHGKIRVMTGTWKSNPLPGFDLKMNDSADAKVKNLRDLWMKSNY